MSDPNYAMLKLTNGLDVIAVIEKSDDKTLTIQDPMCLVVSPGPDNKPAVACSPFSFFADSTNDRYEIGVHGVLATYKPDPKWVTKYTDAITKFRAHRAGILLGQ